MSTVNKSRLNNLQNNLQNTIKEIENVIFDTLEKITHKKINSIIYISSSHKIKYIRRENNVNDFDNFIIYNKGYDWRSYFINNRKITININNYYDIPRDIIELLDAIPETSIEEITNTLYFHLYCLIKMGFNISFVKD